MTSCNHVYTTDPCYKNITHYTLFDGVRANEHEVPSSDKNWSIIYMSALGLVMQF